MPIANSEQKRVHWTSLGKGPLPALLCCHLMASMSLLRTADRCLAQQQPFDGDRIASGWLNRSLPHRTCDWEQLLFVEGADGRVPVDSCPSVEEVTEPQSGRSPEGTLVRLYRDGPNIQRFHEISCRPDVLNRPCGFLDRKLHGRSRCVQSYSYSYAIVQAESDTDPDSNSDRYQPKARQQAPLPPGFSSPWKLGYIQIRSGCGCHVRQSGHNYTSLQQVSQSCRRRHNETDDEPDLELSSEQQTKRKRKKHDAANRKKMKNRADD